MNILFLAEVSAENVMGGAERVLQEQARSLSTRGHRPVILARAPFDHAAGSVKIGSVPEYRYGVSRGHEFAFVVSSIRAALRGFDAVRLERPPDAVIIHQALAGLGAVLARRHEVPFIYVCHSLAHEEYRSRNRLASKGLRVRHLINTAARFWTERIVIRRCSRVLVLSEFMSSRVRMFHKVPPQQIRVIPGAVDQKRFCPAADARERVEIRHRLHLPKDRTLLFTVRNLVPRMGLEAMVDAMPALKQDGSDLLLLIGGEGPLKAELEARIERLGLSGQVQLLGYVPETTLPDYYRATDLFVLPTHELEGFGLIAVEALACGTPVVGTPVGAIPEVLGRVDPMLLAAGSDAGSLATAINQLLGRFRQHPTEHHRLAALGRELVEKDYTWGRHAEAVETVLQEVCAERKR